MQIELSTFINICLGMLCIAVMVQCVRLDRALKAVTSSDMGKNVSALDAATNRAKSVLNEMKSTLSSDGVACARAVEEAKEASQELSLMVKIGSSMADRLIEAAESAPKAKAEVEAKAPAKRKAPAKSKKPAAKRKTTTSSTTRKKAHAKKASARKAAPKKPAATRRKPTPKAADATARDIKVPAKPTNGNRTLRLVGKDETAESQAAAA